MAERIDLSGKKFGKLVVLKYSHYNKSNNAMWICQCDCGNAKIISEDHLMRGFSRSCGCSSKKSNGDSVRKHSLYKGLYQSWVNMKQRCYNPNVSNYNLYGGKGISVYHLWRNNYLRFKQWALKNNWEEGLVLDRVNSDGSYNPQNCQWLSIKENTKKARQKEIFNAWNRGFLYGLANRMQMFLSRKQADMSETQEGE